MKAKRRVLISVFNKAGLIEYARGLADIGCELVSTGGTARKLREAGFSVTEVSDLTGSPEMLDDRVKTLHPKVHAGLIADRDDGRHLRELVEHRIELFDALIINLYPMEEEIARPGATFESVTKNIDIGGPAMMRSAFKGRIPVIMDPADTIELIQRLQAGTHLEHEYCDRLINKGRALIANYTTREAEWSSKGEFVGILGQKEKDLCYGENKSWKSRLFRVVGQPAHRLSASRFRQVGGETPSHINETDLMRGRRMMVQIVVTFLRSFGILPCVAIGLKHGVPCGVGVSLDASEAIRNMVNGNPTAIFGGTVIVNFAMTEEVARVLRTYRMEGAAKRILDVVIGARFTEEAEAILERKAGRCRMFQNEALAHIAAEDLPRRLVRMDDYGELLVQEGEPFVFTPDHPQMEKNGGVLERHQWDMALADAICRTSPSNTITLVKDQVMIGNGCCRPSRVDAANVALMAARDAQHNPTASVAASDSFFPFPDGAIALADAGIFAIFATSGSVNDDKVRDECMQRKTALWRLPDAIARGFYAH